MTQKEPPHFVSPFVLLGIIRPSSLQNHCRAKNIFHSQKEILEAEMEGLAKAMGYDINGGIKETLNKSVFP